MGGSATRSWLSELSIAALAVMPGTSMAAAKEPSADTIVLNADIRTADPAKPAAQALAVRQGRFLAVGTNAEVQALAGKETQVIDAKGATLTPGFIDGHTHLAMGSDMVSGVDLSYIPDKATWLKKIAERSAQLPPGEWLVGGGWDYTLAEGKLPTKEDIDSVVRDRPVYLQDIDGHSHWANSKALELAGITAKTKVPAGGEIVLDPKTGEPTGILKEGANAPFANLPGLQKSEAKRRDALLQTMRYVNSKGITGIHDMAGRQELMDYLALAEKGNLTVRVWYGQFSNDTKDVVQAVADRSMIDHRLAGKTTAVGPVLKFGYIKTIIDGVLSTHTAVMVDDYSDKPGWKGEPFRTQEELEGIVAAANGSGFPISIHAIGDGGVRTALDAFQEAAKPLPLRNRIEHVEIIEPADVTRFKTLNIVASMQPNHATGTIGKYITERVGPEREKWAYVWKAMLNKGVSVVFGSDWSTSPLSPLTQINDAVFRESPFGLGNGPWHPENAVSFDEALTAYTQAGADMTPWGAQIGSITPGKWADFVILDGTLPQPLDRSIRQRSVRSTYFAGKSVFEKK
jgi:predicted amidohydrolase YtcJ